MGKHMSWEISFNVPSSILHSTSVRNTISQLALPRTCKLIQNPDMKNSTATQNIISFEQYFIKWASCIATVLLNQVDSKRRPLKGTEVVGLFTMNRGSVTSLQNLSLETSISFYTTL